MVGLWVVVFWVGWVLLGGVRWLLVGCSGLVMLFGGVLLVVVGRLLVGGVFLGFGDGLWFSCCWLLVFGRWGVVVGAGWILLGFRCMVTLGW